MPALAATRRRVRRREHFEREIDGVSRGFGGVRDVLARHVRLARRVHARHVRLAAKVHELIALIEQRRDRGLPPVAALAEIERDPRGGVAKEVARNRPESLTGLRATNCRLARQRRRPCKTPRSSESSSANERIRTSDLRFRRTTLKSGTERSRFDGPRSMVRSAVRSCPATERPDRTE